MGLVVVSASVSSGSSLPLLSNPGVGSGGIFISALLTYLLAQLHIVGASERDFRGVRTLLVVMIVPLGIVFVGIIALESLSIIGIV